MKVKELIEELEKCDPDYEVTFRGNYDDYYGHHDYEDVEDVEISLYHYSVRLS